MIGNTLRLAKERPILVVLVFLALILVLRLGIIHARLISFSGQQEYREGAQELITRGLLAGNNPYEIQNQPEFFSSYSIICNLCVLPLAKVFEPVLPLHRLVNGIALLLVCSIVFALAYRARRSIPDGLWAGVVAYAALLFYVTPLARPDALGTLIFMLSLLVLRIARPNVFSLTCTSILIFLAFLTKMYFAAPYAAILVYLLVSRAPVRHTILFTALLPAITFLGYILLGFICPTYFRNSLMDAFGCAQTINRFFLVKQAGAFFLLFLPSLLMLFLTANLRDEFQRLLNWSGTEKRDPEASKESFFLIVLIPVTLQTMIIGGHEGAWLTYWMQMVAPLLAIVIAERVSVVPDSPGKYLIPVLAVAQIATLSWMVPSISFERDMGNIENVRLLMANSKEIYCNSPACTSILLEMNQRIFNSGYSEYMGISIGKWFPSKATFYPSDELIGKKVRENEALVEGKLRSGAFSLLVLRPPVASATVQGYVLVATATLTMSYTNQEHDLEFWKPTAGLPR